MASSKSSSSYFTLPSFMRAQKNHDDLAKTEPQQPVLEDDDEKFLQREISKDENVSKSDDPVITVDQDDGLSKANTPVPADCPAGNEESDTPPPLPKRPPAVESPTKSSARQTQKSQDMELPSQEEAEAATRGLDLSSRAENTNDAGEKKTWTSYIPSLGILSKGGSTESEQNEDDKAQSDERQDSSRSWTQFATSYVSSLPASWKTSRDPDGTASPVYNEDGSIDEAATKAKQEREMSVLLDQLSLSSINNRVFAFSEDTQAIFAKFTQVLKDIMRGAPTAYEDLEKLMREAGPRLEQQFRSMPPFIQTLVKSLPMNLGGELLAAAGEKPDDELRSSVEMSTQSAAGTDAGAASGKRKKSDAKKKRRIPGLRWLVSREGAVATMLRTVIVNLQTRFPFLASTTNVVMSLAVFILMFVFWYCYKRGRDTRLEQEAKDENEEVDEKSAEDNDEIDGDDDDNGIDNSNEDQDGSASGSKEILNKTVDSTLLARQKILDLPAPADVPLPAEE